MKGHSTDVEKLPSKPMISARVAVVTCSIIAVSFSVFEIWANSLSYLPMLRINAIHLAFLMLLCFLLYPAKRGAARKSIPVIDWILAIAGAACPLYFSFLFDHAYYGVMGMVSSPLDYVVAVIGIVLLLEAGRRTTGPILPILAIASLLYARYGQYIPGAFAHGGFPWSRIVSRMYMTDAGVFGTCLTISATYLFMFVLFGEFLTKSGVGQFFNNFAIALMGHRRGGAAQVAVVSSAMMGTISGSPIANVVTTGSFTIPLMERIGYTPHFAGGVEALASTGGMIMPPIMGATAFLMAGFLGLPYSTIMRAGLIPALMYYLSLMFVVDMEAQRLGLEGVSREDLPRLGQVMKQEGYLVVPVLVIFFMLIVGFPPIYAAFAGLIAIVGITFVGSKLVDTGRSMGPRQILEALDGAGRKIVSIGVACGVVGFIVGVAGMTSLGAVVAHNIVKLSGGILFIALVFVWLASMIASMGLPAGPCYVVVASVTAPALMRMNVPALAAHFFVFWFGCLSGVTPPVALTSYTAAGIAGANPNKVAITGLMMAAPAFLLPFLLIYRPELLGVATTPARLLVSLTVAAVACLSTACCTHGYFMGKLSMWERVFVGVGSIMLVNPDMWSYVGLALIGITLSHRFYRTWTKRGKTLKAEY